MKEVLLKIKRLNNEFEDIPLPSYQSAGASGMDVRAALNEPFVLKAGSVGLIPTNLILEIPLGYEVQVRARSGLAVKHGIGVLNGPGTIDSDYRGEVKIILFNFGKEDFVIERGDRIAQLIISEVIKANIVEAEEISDTERSSGGFGHSGRK